MRSVVSHRFVLLLTIACLLLAACSSSSNAPSNPATATLEKATEGDSSTTVSCMDTPLPRQSPMDTRDAWQRARALLPSGVAILQPADVPDRFDDPELLAACVETDATPVYTVLYKAGDESLVFILNQGALAWGNTPGPPSSQPQVTVRGIDTKITITTRLAAGTPTGDIFFDLSWQEGGALYQVKASSPTLTADDLVQIANGLAALK